MHGVGYLSPMKSASLDLRTRQLDWCNELEFLHSIERQWLEDKVARESKIIRKVEGADKLEKTEVSKCWKSQWGHWSGRCRASRRARKLKERRELDPGVRAFRVGTDISHPHNDYPSKCSPLWQNWKFESDISLMPLLVEFQFRTLPLPLWASAWASADGRHLGRHAKISRHPPENRLQELQRTEILSSGL